jgi:hypothetical protein
MKKLGLIAAAAAMTASSLFAEGIQINKYLSLGGFIDMSYVNTSKDGPNNDTATFALDQAELDFNLNLGNGLTGRIDLNGSTTASIEQAYINYAMGNWSLSLGKFDTFIGLEGLEPVDMYQFSHSLTWDLEPSQHTGIALGFDNGLFNVAGAIVNGLLSPQNTDINDEPGVALHAGFTPNKAWSFNVNAAFGDEGNSATTTTTGTVIPTGTSTTSATKVDAQLLTADVQWANYGWTVGAEVVAREAKMTASKAEDTGFSLMANYAFTERFALTGRFSTVDKDTTAGTTKKSTDRKEISISPSYAFTPNWLGLVEFRQDDYSAANSDTTTIAVETTLSF